MNIDNKQIPDKVKYIVKTLNDNGFEAFIVGGCVRDLLLGNVPHDFDITTNALPNEVMSCFSQSQQVKQVGEMYGTIRLPYQGETFEITTYRIDLQSLDSRHPKGVIFSQNLKDDLSRRDFTINAIAADIAGNIFDPFNGVEDINNRLIRAVGNPSDRFTEDGLRILRGMRFSSKLGFEIEEKTFRAMLDCRNTLGNIARERIGQELYQIVMGKNVECVLLNCREVLGVIIPEFIPTFDFVQNSKYHQYDIYTHIIKSVALAPNNDAVRFALLFHDIAKPIVYTENKSGKHFLHHTSLSYEFVNNILPFFGYSKKFIAIVSGLVLEYDFQFRDLVYPTIKTAAIKRLLNKFGYDFLESLVQVNRADTLAQSGYMQKEKLEYGEIFIKEMKAIVNSKEPFTYKDLNIGGNDLLELGIPQGVVIGKILNAILLSVIDGHLKNEKSELLNFAKSYWMRMK